MLCVSRRRSCAAALDVVDCVCALLCVVLTCCYCSFFNNDDVLCAQPTTIPIEDCWLTDKTQAKWQRLHSHIHTLSALGYPLFHSLGRCVKMRWDCNRTYASQNEVFFAVVIVVLEMLMLMTTMSQKPNQRSLMRQTRATLKEWVMLSLCSALVTSCDSLMLCDLVVYAWVWMCAFLLRHAVNDSSSYSSRRVGLIAKCY